MSSVASNVSRLDLVLLSTTDFLGGRHDELMRMLDSVRSFADAHPKRRLSLYLLLQRCSEKELETATGWLPSFVVASRSDERVPLSRARNMLLDASASALGPDTIVAFPDDDCWYPVGTLDAIYTAMTSQADLDFWFCRYSSSPVTSNGFNAIKPTFQNVVSRASSNTIIVRGRTVGLSGPFDEDLGVGAKINGGEDTDYAIRCYHHARRSLFLDEAVVGHRDPDRKFRVRYYAGALRAIAKNVRPKPAEVAVLLRKVLVGVWFVASRQMSITSFLAALSESRGHGVKA